MPITENQIVTNEVTGHRSLDLSFGINSYVSFSQHALERIEDYNLSVHEIAADVMLASEVALGHPPKNQFAAFNREMNTSVVFSTEVDGIDTYFNIRTVMNGLPESGDGTVRLSDIVSVVEV